MLLIMINYSERALSISVQSGLVCLLEQISRHVSVCVDLDIFLCGYTKTCVQKTIHFGVAVA